MLATRYACDRVQSLQHVLYFAASLAMTEAPERYQSCASCNPGQGVLARACDTLMHACNIMRHARPPVAAGLHPWSSQASIGSAQLHVAYACAWPSIRILSRLWAADLTSRHTSLAALGSVAALRLGRLRAGRRRGGAESAADARCAAPLPRGHGQAGRVPAAPPAARRRECGSAEAPSGLTGLAESLAASIGQAMGQAQAALEQSDSKTRSLAAITCTGRKLRLHCRHGNESVVSESERSEGQQVRTKMIECKGEDAPSRRAQWLRTATLTWSMVKMRRGTICRAGDYL